MNILKNLTEKGYIKHAVLLDKNIEIDFFTSEELMFYSEEFEKYESGGINQYIRLHRNNCYLDVYLSSYKTIYIHAIYSKTYNDLSILIQNEFNIFLNGSSIIYNILHDIRVSILQYFEIYQKIINSSYKENIESFFELYFSSDGSNREIAKQILENV